MLLYFHTFPTTTVRVLAIGSVRATGTQSCSMFGVRKWIGIICARSGVPETEGKKVLRERNEKDVDIWTLDIQESRNPDSTFHMQGDWVTSLRELTRKYDKPPMMLFSFTPCDYNSRVCPQNHRQDGLILEMDKERIEMREYWCKQTLSILEKSCPVIFCENPAGNMDKVIRRSDGSKAFDEVNPWNFIYHGETFNEGNWRDKKTHLFSGGDMRAIEQIPLTNYITMNERPHGVIAGWVGKQKDDVIDTAANKRSVTSPGMFRAMMMCGLDRYTHYQANPSMHMKFQFNKDMIVTEPKIKCSTNVYNSNGTLRFTCNLGKCHAAKAWNYRRGEGLQHGLFDYDNNCYIDKEELPTTRLRKRYNPDKASISATSVQSSPKHKSRIPKPITKKERKVYTCRKCGQPKKGHTCQMVNEISPCQPCETPKIYKCSKCGKPKKGHVCRFAF